MRGFLIGITWGAVVAGLAAVALSLAIGFPEEDGAGSQAGMVPPVGESTPEVADTAAEGAEAPAAEEVAEPPAPAPVVGSDAEPALGTAAVDGDAAPVPGADTVVARPAAPDAVLAEPADTPRPAGADTDPPQAPSVGAAPAVPEDLPAEGETAPVAVTSEAPVLPGAQAQAPDAPAADSEPVVATDPGAPPAPAAEVALADTPEPLSEPAPSDAAPEVAPTPSDAAAEPATESAEAAPDDAADPAAPSDAATDEPAETAEAAEATDPAEDAPLIDIAPTETETAARPAIGTPAGSLINRPSAVPEGRLPRITDAPATQTPATDTSQLPAASNVPADSPLVRHAAAASVPEGAPRVAVVLIDDGSSPLGPAMLDGFPFALTIAIDPSQPDAAQTARAYREAGLEVMALADVPQGALPTDVEIALAGALDAVPQAVALLEDPDGGVQASREISAQVTSFLVQSGHGLVTQPKGLNTAQQLAAREGVASATLFRDFDGEGQNAGAMRRFLQNGAFRARQEGAAVMLGRLKADTVTALIQWGLQDINEGLALVPVSVVLRESLNP